MKNINAEKYKTLGDNARREHKIDLAIENYNKAIYLLDNKEDKISLIYNLALMYDENEDIDEAINAYSNIIKLDDTEAGAYYGMATEYEKIGDFDQAKDFYMKAINLDPDYDKAWFFLADLSDELGEIDNAIKYYNKSIEISKDYMSYNNLASIYERIKDYDMAKKLILESININNVYFLSQFNLGVIEKALGNFNASEAAYLKSEKLNPRNPNVYLNLSALYIDNELYEKSIEILTKGIKNNPKEANLYYNKGCSLIKIGMIDKAFENLKMAVGLDMELLEYFIADNDFDGLREHDKYIEILNMGGIN